jgi:hypothetical protein
MDGLVAMHGTCTMPTKQASMQNPEPLKACNHAGFKPSNCDVGNVASHLTTLPTQAPVQQLASSSAHHELQQLCEAAATLGDTFVPHPVPAVPVVNSFGGGSHSSYVFGQPTHAVRIESPSLPEATVPATAKPTPDNATVLSQTSSHGSGLHSHVTSLFSSASNTGKQVVVKVRSLADICSSVKQSQDLHQKARDVDSSFPIGPIQGDEGHLLEGVRTWARNPRTGGGGHGVRISGFLPYAESRGRRFRILCSKNKMRTEVCPWTCLYEESKFGP